MCSESEAHDNAEDPRGGMPSSWRDAPREPLSMDCRVCAPLACDDPDNHLGVPSEYTPLKNRGCRCGADAGGWDCMCFENEG